MVGPVTLGVVCRQPAITEVGPASERSLFPGLVVLRWEVCGRIGDRVAGQAIERAQGGRRRRRSGSAVGPPRPGERCEYPKRRAGPGMQGPRADGIRSAEHPQLGPEGGQGGADRLVPLAAVGSGLAADPDRASSDLPGQRGYDR